MGCGKSSVKSSMKPSKIQEIPQVVVPTQKLLSPDSFSDIYELGEKLATLPSAEIRRCIHKTSKISRSVKIIQVDNPEMSMLSESKMKREVKALSGLDHPNILKTYDILFDSKRFYVLMEPWEGGRLFDMLGSLSAFSEAQAANIIEQILSAVSYAHSKKVLHRDLHPGIIFLVNRDNSFWVKIGEFGSSAYIDPEHKLEGKLETSYYVAPEVFDGYYNEKCDLWSVGVIAYMLLAGCPPFENSNCRGIYDIIQSAPLNTTKLTDAGVSDEAVSFVTALLEKQFPKRPSATAALAHPWIALYKSLNAPNSAVLHSSLGNIKNFSQESGLKSALRTFISSQVLASHEMKDTYAAFKALDANGDGKVCREELFKHYVRHMSAEEARELIDQVMAKVDVDNSGKIEYSEFVNASAYQQQLLSKKNLEAAFSMLDKDRSGALCIDELQGLLEGAVSTKNQSWTDLISEADKNGDGQIDLAEFSELLLTKFNV